jgi:hypothetical protein
MRHRVVQRVQPAALITALSDFPRNRAGKHSDSRNTARLGQAFSVLHFMYVCHRIITVPSFIIDEYKSYRNYIYVYFLRKPSCCVTIIIIYKFTTHTTTIDHTLYNLQDSALRELLL